MANQTMSPNRSMNQIISDDDASKMILKNINVIVVSVCLLILALIGYGFYLSVSSENQAMNDSKIYQFENGALKSYEQNHDGKLLVSSLKKLKSEVGNYIALLPVILKASDLLNSRSQYTENLEVLKLGVDSAKNEYANYFLLSRLAVAYEDLGQDQNAIDTIEKMNSQSVKIMEGKNYLDLGRLYLKKGDKEKAKASFNYVIEKAKDESEFVKVAKIYLSKF